MDRESDWQFHRNRQETSSEKRPQGKDGEPAVAESTFVEMRRQKMS